MALKLQHEWQSLVGRTVVVKLASKQVRHGTVGDVTVDGQALWLDWDATYPRRLYDRGSGFEMWMDEQGAPGSGRRRKPQDQSSAS